MVLIPLGLGGLSSILSVYLGQYRLLFTVMALVLLAAAHYLMYKKGNPVQKDRIILWVTTATVLMILLVF